MALPLSSSYPFELPLLRNVTPSRHPARLATADTAGES